MHFRIHFRKRGQITLFVILGLIVVFAFGFLIYTKVKISTEQLQIQAQRQIQEYISQNEINQYVTSCLDIVTTEAIIRASMQTGQYDFSGKIKNIDYIEYHDPTYDRTFNISIVLNTNTNCPIIKNNPPDYPYSQTHINPVNDLMNIYKGPDGCYYTNTVFQYSGFFGYNRLEKLCDWNGANKIGATPTYGFITCQSGTYSDASQSESIQQNIQDFISTELPKCADFKEILKRSPNNITIAHNPTTQITFDSSGFTVKVSYPFTITFLNRQPITRMIDFSVEKSVPFKEIYDFAFNEITSDARDANFDIINDKSSIQEYNGYEVKKISNVDNTFNNIIQIIDNSTQLLGKPLIFQFGITNRRPALEYMHQASAGSYYDIAATENDTIDLKPQGYDPDEDLINYNYSLWKEDYDETYNFSNPRCIDPTQASLSYIIANCSSRNSSAHPHNWTKSSEFIITKQNSSYTTNKNDTGYHEVKISIWDGQKLMDWQTVKIIVFDLPIARLSGRNIYQDVTPEYASVEDPYILNGSNSTVGLSSIIHNHFTQFIWNDTEFLKTKKIITDNDKIFYIPNDTNGIYDITIIPKYVFNNETNVRREDDGSRIGNDIYTEHNISLTVNTSIGWTDTTYLKVKVFECLGHRNSTNPPYPYNAIPYDVDNSFFADHSCCYDDNTYKQSDIQCFNNTQYGSIYAFDVNPNNYGIKPYSPPSQYIFSINKTDVFAGAGDVQPYNDIFERIFSRYCSGNSGNTCTGSASESRTAYKNCADNNNNANTKFQEETCTGPPISPQSTQGIFTASSDKSVQCDDYPQGITFQLIAKNNNIPGYEFATGKCTNGPQCASSSKDFFDNLPKIFTCDGTCDGNGGCNVAINCICDSTCGSVASSSACNGLTSPGTGNPTDGKTYCTAGPAGSTVYQDSCSSCGLVVATPKICTSTGPGKIGCTADNACDGKNANTKLSENSGCTMSCNSLNCGAFKYDASLNGNNGGCYGPTCNSNNQCVSGKCCTNPAGCNDGEVGVGNCY